jgi:hypothetical protein
VADLVAIIDKMQRGESSQHRLHPRARRDGGVQIIDRKGLVHRAHFLDYAQMGARLSLVGNGKLQPKDSVQIVYGSSAEPGKFHKVEAKIIWATETGGLVDQLIGNQQQMAGVRFIAKY